MKNDKELQKAVLAVMMGKQVEEAKKPLHPNQQKLDVHEPEKDELTAKDFEMLRAGKKAKMKEEIEIEEGTESEADYHDRMHRLAAHYHSMSDEKKVSLGKIPGRAEQYKQAVAYAKANPDMKKEEVDQVDEASYSTKAARAGKDIGKPGKNFAKIAAKAGAKYGSKEAGARVAGAILKKLRSEEYTEDELALIENAIDEGWEEMLKAAKERAKPQPSGGSGVKQGTRYGGAKQKLEKPVKPMKEDADYTFGDYLKAAKEKFSEEEAVKVANTAFNNKDTSIFSSDSEA